MKNKSKFEEIAEFFKKQKIDEGVANAYQQLDTKAVMMLTRFFNTFGQIAKYYEVCEVQANMKKSEDLAKAKEIVEERTKDGFKATVQFVGDCKQDKKLCAVVVFFEKENVTDMRLAMLVPYGELVQFAETINQWLEK